MARPPRCFVHGVYHITSHSSDQRWLFLSDGDRRDFLRRLDVVCQRFELELLSYVLLGNHYHTLVAVPDARVSTALQRLHGDYSRDHNRRWRRSAHLFRAHPFARRVESDDDLVGVYSYLALNPVEAGLVRDPLEWPWGSARAHAGLDPPRVPLSEEHLRAVFGGGEAWRARFCDFISARAAATVRPS